MKCVPPGQGGALEWPGSWEAVETQRGRADFFSIGYNDAGSLRCEKYGRTYTVYRGVQNGIWFTATYWNGEAPYRNEL